MSITALEGKPRKHWATWLPARTADLKAEGMWETALRRAAISAQERIDALMKAGFRAHEAEEVALKEFILLDPEPADEDDWEAQELAQMEADYQAMWREVNRRVALLDDAED